MRSFAATTSWPYEGPCIGSMSFRCTRNVDSSSHEPGRLFAALVSVVIPSLGNDMRVSWLFSMGETFWVGETYTFLSNSSLE